MAGATSKLIKDLSNVPSIVGGLGLSVAEAQKAFNLDYLENIERLLGLIKSMLDAKKKDNPGEALVIGDNVSVVEALLMELSPSRYQFTETTLAVKLDLAQTMDIGVSVGFGASVGAVAVNASLTVGYGYDYRAAAEVRTILHAIPPDKTVFKELLGRAKDIDAKALTLPAGAAVDTAIVDKSHEILTKLIGEEADKPKAPDEPTTPGGT